MATLICRGLTFAHPGQPQPLFRDLDLTLDTHWRAALVGANGRGKTTLLRLLTGELDPDRGAIDCQVPVRMMPAEPPGGALTARQAARRAAGPFSAWESRMTALLEAGDEQALREYGELQSRYQAAGGYTLDAELDAQLDELGVDSSMAERPFAELSGGEQSRCLLAALFVTPGYALIDEPTNHLDREGRTRLASYLAKKSGFLVVSHDRAFLDRCTDHVVALNADTIEVQRTSFSTWRAHLHARLAEQRHRNALLKREIAAHHGTARDRRAGAFKREADKMAHTDKGFTGARAARQMKRALAAEARAKRAADERAATLTDIEKSYDLTVTTEHHVGQLITAQDLVVLRNSKPLFAPLSFALQPGERVAVLGPNGCGKTSLLDVLSRGQALEHRGELLVPTRFSIARAHQQPLWTTGLLQDHLSDVGLDESRFRQIMAALGERGDGLERPLETLSFGQRKKIDLARTLLDSADLLVWDEPLNFLDIDTRELIESAVLRDAPTLLFTEHDAAFVERIATTQLQLMPPQPEDPDGS